MGGVRFVTVAAVTARAGLHRTGVRRYYASKEELLLELAERGWGQWRDAIQNATAGRCDLGPTEIAEILVKTIASLPVFCDLLAHVAMTLEDDVELDRARRYKLIAFAAHDQLVGSLQRTTTMTPTQVQTLVTTTVALTASLWQTAHPSPTLAKLYEQEPEWGHYALDFEPRLTLILQATAIGLAEVLPAQ
ncbi:TetR family transcriptional regulator [Mycobacterium sp. MS1601]|nr:TetR family transcriptional regulator [Mycobacterium sp. MS1601]